MEISKKSWHYRFIRRFGGFNGWQKLNGKTHTTCSYIQLLVLVMLRNIFNVLVLLTICFAASFIVGCAAVSAYNFVVGGPAKLEQNVFNVVGLVTWITVGFFAFLYSVFKIIDLIQLAVINQRRKNRKKKADKKAKEPSLLQKAAQDRKDGICTIVKFVD